MRPILVVGAAGLATAIAELSNHNQELLEDLIIISCDSPGGIMEHMVKMMQEKPEIFRVEELNLLIEDLLNEDDFEKIFKRLYSTAKEAFMQDIVDMQEAPGETIHMRAMHYLDDVEAPIFYYDSPLEMMRSHPMTPGKSQKKGHIHAQPPRSHRSAFPFVPSRHGNR